MGWRKVRTVVVSPSSPCPDLWRLVHVEQSAPLSIFERGILWVQFKDSFGDLSLRDPEGFRGLEFQLFELHTDIQVVSSETNG